MIRSCPHCGTSNRVPPRHLAHQGRCGACKAALPPVDTPLDVDSVEEFDALTAGATVPVLVDFWAEWCGPCRAAAPHVKRTAQAMAGRALVLKVDTEKLPELAQRHRVQGIPNFMVIKDGRPVMQQPGLVDSRQMQGWLERAGA